MVARAPPPTMRLLLIHPRPSTPPEESIVAVAPPAPAHQNPFAALLNIPENVAYKRAASQPFEVSPLELSVADQIRLCHAVAFNIIGWGAERLLIQNIIRSRSRPSVMYVLSLGYPTWVTLGLVPRGSVHPNTSLPDSLTLDACAPDFCRLQAAGSACRCHGGLREPTHVSVEMALLTSASPKVKPYTHPSVYYSCGAVGHIHPPPSRH